MKKQKHLLFISVLTILYIPFAIHFGWRIRNTIGWDFPSLYAAGVAIFSLKSSPYDLKLLNAILLGKFQVFPFLYPPPSVVFLGPFSFFKIENANLIFLMINHLLIFVASWLLLQIFSPLPKRDGWSPFIFLIGFSAMVGFVSIQSTIKMGQVNILLFCLVLCFWMFSNFEKVVTAGLFLSLAILLKVYPIILILPLLLLRKFKEVFWTGFFLVLIVLISYPLLPADTWSDWLFEIVPTGGYLRASQGFSEWNQSINGFFTKIRLEDTNKNLAILKMFSAKQLAYSCSFLAMLVLAIVTIRLKSLKCNQLDRMMMLSMPTIILVAPVSWEHHLVLLIPTLLLLLTCRIKSEQLQYVWWLVSAGFYFLLGTENIPHLRFGSTLGIWLFSAWAASNKNCIFLSEQTSDTDKCSKL